MKGENEKDYLLVVDTLREILSIEPNNAVANFYLGFLYHHGLGLEKSPKLSITYYK